MSNYLTTQFDINAMVDILDELPLWSAPFGLKLLDNVKYKADITALDIGFGTGFPLIELAMRLGESSTVYGIEPWKEAIDRTNKKLDSYCLNNIKLIQGVGEAIPLADKSVDLIISNNGINNCDDIGKVFDECSRVLSSGGQFMITMNLDKTMIEFYDQLYTALMEWGLYNEIDLMHRHIYNKRRPVKEIVEMLEERNFNVESVDYDQFCYRFTSGTAMLNHCFIRMYFMEAWKNLLPADKVEPIFKTIETRLNEKARTEGSLKLSVPFVLIDSAKK